jgi:CheY-like chemotaxis protein
MPKKLLVADDSVTIHKVVTLTFADEDVIIETATDGAQAIEKAKRIKPDFVLADVFMPGRSGYDLCESLKSDPEFADVPVILLVGTFETFDEGEAARVKCDGHLTKPFDTSELLRMFKSFTGRKLESTRAKSGNDFGRKGPVAAEAPTGSMASHKTVDSFLGSAKILDLFGDEMLAQRPVQHAEAVSAAHPWPETAATAAIAESGAPEAEEAEAAPTEEAEAAPRGTDLPGSQVIRFPGARESSPEPSPILLPEDMIDAIVERVVRQMSQDVVKQVAWEVVPKIAETIVRQSLKGRGIASKS